MPRNRPTDLNSLAARIVAEATGQAEKTDPPAEPSEAATKRGKARAEKLTAEQRSTIARAAARARWGGADTT